MNINYASQHQGLMAWAGATPEDIDLRNHVNFSFTFEVVNADLVADAVFNVLAAPASDADPCVPGAYVPVAEVFTCAAPWGAVPAPQATVVIPGGSKVGSICTGTLPCKPDAFLKFASASGPTINVRIVAILSLPK
jgi:hypothetical protein